MPSGFQQDSNQLTPRLYRIVWVANTGTYATADGTDNGAITPNSADSFTTLPTTLAKGLARARGNMRFRNVVNRLTGLADCQILDIETGISGGGVEVAGDNQVTSLAFTVKYDRADGVIAACTGLNGSTTAVDGSTTITTVALAVKDQFVRGFRDATTAAARVYNGTTTEDTQQSVTVAAPDVAADIWADTTVALIDGTELVTVDAAGAAE
jgi:6-phosphogluconate dehydrogenase